VRAASGRTGGRPAPRAPAVLVVVAVAGTVASCQGPSVSTGTSAGDGAADPPVVRLDGRFGDWQEATVVRPRPAGFGRADLLDFGEIRLRSDDRWLYLSLEVSRTVNIQAMEGSIEIVLDGDGARETGGDYAGLMGADAVVSFSVTDPPGGGGYGAGAAVQPVRDDATAGLRSPYAIELGVAPTHAAERFELRMRRGSRVDGGGPFLLGPSARAVLRYRREGVGRAETETLDLAFPRVAARAPARRAARVPSPRPGTDRVVVWNVASESFRDRGVVFGRVLAALRPDVVLLDEVFEGVDEAHLRRVFREVPAPAGAEWRFVIGRTGDEERSVVATHRAVRPEPALLEVDFPAEAVQRLRGAAPSPPPMIDEIEAGLSVAGAWLTLGGREALFVPVDFQSAGHLGSPQDRLRIEQARTLRARIDRVRSAAAGGVDEAVPVVIGGDLNLVASTRPLTLLAGGADVDGTALEAVDGYTLPGGSQATWRNPGAPFVPGRLDYLLIPDAALEAVAAFVFDSGHLAAGELRRLGLRPEDSRVSDHRPVVADLRPRWSMAEPASTPAR